MGRIVQETAVVRTGGSRNFLTAGWRDLLLISFEAAPSLLEPYLPPGLEFDDWQGRRLVSLIGFRFLDTRILGWRVPFHGNFPEVNLRFYVRRQAPEGWRRGVVFLREFVPKAAVAQLARRLYQENYASVPMIQEVEPGRSAKYGWAAGGKRSWISAQAAGPAAMPQRDSLETFIIDHHFGYTKMRGGGCTEYRVERPDWRVYPVESFEMHLEGDGALPLALPRDPLSVIFAEGSEVGVSFGRALR